MNQEKEEIKQKETQKTTKRYVDGNDVKITFKPGASNITGIAVAEG